ncbi:ankyrin repeat-containing domain protein, partial [Collybia nuda]
DAEGNTPLCAAAIQGHGVIVRYLGDKGAQIDLQGILDKNGKTPLHEAAHWGYSDIVTYLRGKGAHLELQGM